MPNNSSNRVKTESIDEVIIRLLGLQDGAELDYQVYFKILKNKLLNSRLGGKSLHEEEDRILRDELKRVKREIDRTGGKRIKIKKGKTKVASKGATNIPKDTTKSSPGGALVKISNNKLSKDRFVFVNVKDITEKSTETKKDKKTDNFDEIRKILDSINNILKSKFKLDKKQEDSDRKEKETERRSKKESTLEGFKKGISGIVSATKKMLSPFQNIIDRILRFVFFTLLGRAFTKFMEWMNDKGNQEKFNAFIDFLTDHWPALAGLYILFGTSFGKLVRGLLKGATRMIVALAMNIGKVKRFITKNKKLAFLGLAIAPLASRELGNIFGENKETPESGLIPREGADLKDAKASVDQAKQTTPPRIPAANVGGIIPKLNMGGLIPSFIGGGMDFQQGVPITGAGKDDTLIAAKTGEAILTQRDQQDIGQRYIDRETGEPLNIPQYLSGRKPGSVSMGNIRFPGFGGGFNLGGMVSKFDVGGMVGNKAPKISPSDYNSLLAISALESDESQGRSDVAQSLYNRLHAASKYGVNFNQKTNSLKDLITAGGGSDSGGQFEPTFSNKADWLNIKDRNSAAIAIMNSSKGKKYKWGLKDAMQQLDATEKALKNPAFQAQSQKHVGGRAYFLGTSQHDNMKPGDVLRGPRSNFFSPWYLEGTPYDKERRNIASPIPEMLLPKSKGKVKPKGKSNSQSLFGGILGGIQSLMNFGKKQGGGFVNGNTGIDISGATADTQLTALQRGEYVLPTDTVNRLGTSLIDKLVAMTDNNSAPFKRGVLSRTEITPYKNFGSGSGGMITLPPIVSSGGGMQRPRSSGLAGGSEVPNFSAIAPNNERAMNASIYGLVG